MTLELMVNGAVALLLVVTIVVATVLSVRLGRMRRTRGEIEALVSELGNASATAEASLRGFRELAEGVGKDVEERVRAGQGLREELTFLIDRASTIADRLAATPSPRPQAAGDDRADTSGSRAARLVQAIRPRASPAQARGAEAGDAGIAHAKSDAERALMRALESAR